MSIISFKRILSYKNDDELFSYEGKHNSLNMKGNNEKLIVSQKDYINNNNYKQNFCRICGFKIMKYPVLFCQCYVYMCSKCIDRIFNKQKQCGIKRPFCPLCLEEAPDIVAYLNNASINNVIECKICSNIYVFEPNNDISDKSSIQYKVTCNNCFVSMCTNCKTIPFHEGYTCDEYTWFLNDSLCRVCQKPTDPNILKNLGTCLSKTCNENVSNLCNKKLPCGHKCCGYKCKDSHPACPLCTPLLSKCLICRKHLWGTPCLSLNCGHSVHKACAFNAYERMLNGENMLPICPYNGCGFFMEHPSLSDSFKVRKEEIYSIFKQVDIKANLMAEKLGITYSPLLISKTKSYAWAGEFAAINFIKKNFMFYICSLHGKGCCFFCGSKDDQFDINYIKTVCPRCDNSLSKSCKICQSHIHIIHKCFFCCNVAEHIKLYKEKGIFVCNECFNTNNEIFSTKCVQNCEFSPHPTKTSTQIFYCYKCNKLSC